MTSHKLTTYEDPVLDRQIEEVVHDLSGHDTRIATLESGATTLGDRVTALETVEDWVAPTLLNSWVNYGVPYSGAGYYKDPMGRVHLRGVVKSGTIGSAIFILPTGYRPTNNEIMVGISNNALARVDVYANGSIMPISGSTTWVALDGISFRAA